MLESVDRQSPAFGPCAENPKGDEHAFVDMGPALGARRWRCRYCHRGQRELRSEISGLQTAGE